MRILLAEDDASILKLVQNQLEQAGYLIDPCTNGPETWEKGEIGEYSAIVLDLGLPGMDGLSILKRWRGAGVETPVLILTARGSWMERVDGFDAGADDYLPKPFRPEELVARLRALIRRSGIANHKVLRAGRFTIDDATRRITFDGHTIEVSPMEYRLIAYLSARKGQTVPAIDLAAHVQGRDDDTAKNAIEAMVARLRKKTSADAIENRRGFGYVLADDVS
jgi:DNA-binding response OmpR family regulator